MIFVIYNSILLNTRPVGYLEINLFFDITGILNDDRNFGAVGRIDESIPVVIIKSSRWGGTPKVSSEGYSHSFLDFVRLVFYRDH